METLAENFKQYFISILIKHIFMKKLKFVFMFALLIGASSISYAQCEDVHMPMPEKQIVEGKEHQDYYRITVEFDDSGDNYIELHRDGINSPSKRCDKSPCNKGFIYTKSKHTKTRNIVCYSSKCNRVAVGCTVVIDGL